MALFGRRTKTGADRPTGHVAPRTGRRHAEAPRYRSAPERSLPVNIVSMMEEFGRDQFDPFGSELDAASVGRNVLAPLTGYAQRDPVGFVRELAGAVVEVGGWAVYGAERLVHELVGTQPADSNYQVIVTRSLDFLRSCGVPNNKLTGYEWHFWLENQGRTEPWLAARPTPDRSETRLTELGVGEMRRVVQIDGGNDSNVIYARHDHDGVYRTVIDARRSDADPRRVQNDHLQAASLYDLYLELARTLQVPPFWYDSELEVFFPYPRPKVAWSARPGQ